MQRRTVQFYKRKKWKSTHISQVSAYILVTIIPLTNGGHMTEPGLSGGDCEVTGQKRQIQEDYINDFAISASEIKTE